MASNLAFCHLVLRYILVVRGFKYVSNKQSIPTKNLYQNYFIAGVIALFNVTAPLLVVFWAKSTQFFNDIKE